MGKKNVVTKKYISNNEKFADIFNYYIYNGRKVIQPDNLKERDTTELIGILMEDSGTYTEEKIRDVLKQCVVKQSSMSTYVLMGIESQADVHYAMPVRNALYDMINYASQVEEKSKEHRKNKDLKGAEFLSGFSKYDKIKPIITLVIYFGSDEWDGPRSLYEMLETHNKDILKYVPDYKMNILIPSEIENTEKFSTDMRYIIEFLKVAKDKAGIRKLFENNRDIYSNLNIDAAIVLKECANINIIDTEKKEVVDMCKGIEDWIRDEKMETKIEMSIRYYVEGYLPLSKALEECELTEEDFFEEVEKYKNKVNSLSQS